MSDHRFHTDPLGTIHRIAGELRAVVGALEPGTWAGEQARDALAAFDEVVRLAGAGRVLAAGRVDATGVWRRSGHRSASAFVADELGITRGESLGMVRTAAALPELGALDEAVRGGEISGAAAAEVAQCASEHPEATDELLAVARRSSIRRLRERCAQVHVRGEGADERQRRIRAERSCTDGAVSDSSWELRMRHAVADGALISHALDLHQRDVFELARERGDQEGFAAYRADAALRMARLSLGMPVEVPKRRRAELEGLVGAGVAAGSSANAEPAVQAGAFAAGGSVVPGGSSANGGSVVPGGSSANGGSPNGAVPTAPLFPVLTGSGGSIRKCIVVRVDHAALRRGRVEPGEVCEIVGVGPVPLGYVDAALEEDPIVKAVVMDGRDVVALATVERKLKADLRLAVRERDRVCQVPGCDTSFPVELDHEHTIADKGPDTYDNLRVLCRPHHTQRGLEGYELTGPVGQREWRDPDGRVIAADPPPDLDDPGQLPDVVTLTRRRARHLRSPAA